MNKNAKKLEPVDILLVEDNPGDVRLCEIALKESKVYNNLEVVNDGAEALEFLRKKGKYKGKFTPDLILLDLNLPKMDGRKVLEKIKEDKQLRKIPVVILTTSQEEEDILKTYDLHANCYITKPLDITRFIEIVRSINDYWFSIVKLPPKK